MRRNLIALLALILLTGVLLIVPVNQSFIARADVSEGERLAMYSKPAVVHFYVGPVGTFLYQDPHWSSPVSYQIGYVAKGSGFFISSNGYIATNAHVAQMWHDGEDKAKQSLWNQFIKMVAQNVYKADPSRLSQNDANFIYQHAALKDFYVYHHVVIPDGSAFPFEDKPSGYGAPTGENENAKDVAVVKIEVKNAPVLVFGDSEAVRLQDHITVIGYPGAGEVKDRNVLAAKSVLEASITDGKVSANKASSSGAPVLQISAAATHGNSGGPVLNDKGEVIGLLTFGGDPVYGQEVQGFAFAVSSNTALEFVKQVGASNQLGLTDNLYREGLDLYWQGHYSEAMPKFEQVKRLFPQHSEVDRLIQSSQQAITEGKDQSGFGRMGWLVGGVIVFIFLIAGIIVIGGVIFFLLRRRGKAQRARAAAGASMPSQPSGPPATMGRPEPARPAPMSYSPSPAGARPPEPARAPAAPAMARDLSRTVAIPRATDTAPISYGSIKFVSGMLTGQKFEVKAEGVCIGRDSALSQIVLADPRISKRHVWIGVKDGRVAIADQGSRNGTFLNDPKTERVTEAVLTPGDTVILGESDVARFEYQV